MEHGKKKMHFVSLIESFGSNDYILDVIICIFSRSGDGYLMGRDCQCVLKNMNVQIHREINAITCEQLRNHCHIKWTLLGKWLLRNIAELLTLLCNHVLERMQKSSGIWAGGVWHGSSCYS